MSEGDAKRRYSISQLRCMPKTDRYPRQTKRPTTERVHKRIDSRLREPRSLKIPDREISRPSDQCWLSGGTRVRTIRFFEKMGKERVIIRSRFGMKKQGRSSIFLSRYRGRSTRLTRLPADDIPPRHPATRLVPLAQRQGIWFVPNHLSVKPTP